MPAVTRIIRIKAQPHVPGGRFCRAGLCFGAAFTTVAEDELTAEQLAALQAEPMLVVEIAEELKPTAPQAKAEAKAAAPAPAAPVATSAQAMTEAAEEMQDAAESPAAAAKTDAPASDAKTAKPEAKPATKKEGGK